MSMKPVEVSFAQPHAVLPGAQFADAFQLTVAGQNLTAMEATKRAVYGAPSWINRLLALRTLLVRPFGLKPGANPDPQNAGPDHIGMFPVLSQQPRHVLLGMNDRHLDFRLVIDIVDHDGGRQTVTAATIVKTHNVFGRAYLAFVKPFHKAIVPAMLARVVSPVIPLR
jgi:hypothetical protein